MIRTATADDLDLVTGLEVQCFGAAAWSAGLVAAALAAGQVLIAEDVGYAVVRVIDDVADLDRIAVHPQSRRRGLARGLLDAVLAHSRGQGAARVLLEVASDNQAAIGLYSGHGFAQIHRRRGYYPGGVDALVMQLALGT